jgi:uroporphyrin-III C-methyltransferase/precorrin-2 dehydrogenase/sirohydrochlorin ferrochelatase
MYPAMLSVSGRSCLVVGGGGVALRKVDGLLLEGARVTVVAPEPVAAVAELAARGAIALERRGYRAGEAATFALVFAATDDREVNRQVAADAEAAGRWVNVADDPELCTFHLPAQVRRGSLKLVIASGGEAPFVVKRLRRALEVRFGAEWAVWLDAAARLRRRVRALRLPADAQERAFDAFFRATVDEASFAVRVPTEPEVERFAAGAGSAPSAAPSPRPAPPVSEGGEGGRRGFVALVGAGPGDPGLLTVRARALLLAADAVVYDRLAAAALPTDLPARVELHAVGKQSGSHPVPQEEINALLVRLGREGRRVVRLKGGDPYVFGRGSEEAEALHAAGIAFEVVPGVTSGIAVPAYAGIPVTHRREAVRVTLLTAHESAKDGGSQVRWDLLAQDRSATIVGYMGVTSLPEVSARLAEAGLDPATPAALIQRGTTSRQRVARSTLRDLAAEAKRAGIGPPALFVIGPTAGHADRLDWFTSRPLFGERLAMAAPAGALGEALRAAGAEVVELPLPVTEAARVALGALPVSGAVLASAAEVDALDDERDRGGLGAEAVAWCLGPAAAQRARERGWARVQEVDAAGLAAALAARRAVEAP